MSRETTIPTETTRSDESMVASRSARIAGDQRLTASEAAVQCLKEYSREHPEVVALWAFGLGFVLGWKLKIW